MQAIRRLARNSTLIHVEPSGEGRYLTLTYDVRLASGTTPGGLATPGSAGGGVDGVNIMSSCNDVEY